MKISQYSFSVFQHKVKQGLKIRIGPFSFEIKSSIIFLAEEIYKIYAHYEVLDDDIFIDFHITMSQPYSHRRWLWPQVDFFLDHRQPFKPLPLNQAYAMLEWGMNWCIANHAHHYLILHSAVVEKNGVSVILPAPPGSGKSTLCAALVGRGWRLFSDELALINLKSGELHPSTRPINLKNNSIDIIKAFIPESINSITAKDTHKGTVSLFKPPNESVEKIDDYANPRFVIYPKYIAQSPEVFSPMDKAQAFSELIDNSFNYHELGAQGFKAMTQLIKSVDCYSYEYSQLDDAIAHFNALAEDK